MTGFLLRCMSPEWNDLEELLRARTNTIAGLFCRQDLKASLSFGR